jgi:prohead serine protease
VGRTTDIHVEASPKPALVQTVEFADTEFARQVHKLYVARVLNAVSVGFRPLEKPQPITDEEGRTTGYFFPKNELLELSCVSLPANVNAVQRAVNDGIILASDAEKFLLTGGGERKSLDDLLAPDDANELASPEDADRLIASIDALGQMVDERPFLAQLKPSVTRLGVSALSLAMLVRQQSRARAARELEKMLGM